MKWNSSFVALICSFHIACSLTDNAQEIMFFFYLLSRLGCRPRWWWTATTKRYCTSTNGLRDISLVSDDSRWSFMLANVFTRMLSWKIGTARPGYCFYTQAHVSSSGQSTSRRSCNHFRIMPETPNIRTYHYTEASVPLMGLSFLSGRKLEGIQHPADGHGLTQGTARFSSTLMLSYVV